MNIRVFGRGKVGRTLHAAMRQAQLSVRLDASQATPRTAPEGAVIYVLAVPDAHIRATSERLAPHIRKSDIVLHCSGNRGPEELGACRAAGAQVAVMHPLVSFASPRATADLRNTTWIARGDKSAVRSAQKLARALGARCVDGPSGAPAYHAAAVIAANGSAALAHLSVRILQHLGLDSKVAEAGVAGLLRSVATNIERVGLPAALTGPVMRGDVDTVRSHLHALLPLEPDLSASYAALVPIILSSAQMAGLSATDSQRLHKAVKITHPKPRARSKGKPARPHPR